MPATPEVTASISTQWIPALLTASRPLVVAEKLEAFERRFQDYCNNPHAPHTIPPKTTTRHPKPPPANKVCLHSVLPQQNGTNSHTWNECEYWYNCVNITFTTLQYGIETSYTCYVGPPNVCAVSFQDWRFIQKTYNISGEGCGPAVFEVLAIPSKQASRKRARLG